MRKKPHDAYPKVDKVPIPNSVRVGDEGCFTPPAGDTWESRSRFTKTDNSIKVQVIGAHPGFTETIVDGPKAEPKMLRTVPATITIQERGNGSRTKTVHEVGAGFTPNKKPIQSARPTEQLSETTNPVPDFACAPA